MSIRKIRLIAVLLLVFVFNFLFWQEKPGLNSLVFSPIYLGVLWYLFPESRQNRHFLITAAGMLLAAAMVTWHNSAAAKVAWIVSGMCAAGFAQADRIRFILDAFFQYLNSMMFMFGPFFSAWGGEKTPVVNRKSGQKFRLGFIPVMVIGLFYILYYSSNDKFAALADRFWEQIGRLFQWDISLTHIFFIVCALLICGGAVWKRQTTLEEYRPDDLERIRPNRKKVLLRHRMADLSREFAQSQTLLWILNGMLLIVNTTDIWYVWFGFDDAARQDLQSYVHEGTYTLIFSIVVAMFVLFHVFRKNLNFYPGNQYLIMAAAIWLVQNGILAFSVGIRTWRYIDFHGLAYKRIGVILFLILVFFGLATLWLKIARRKTMSWLWTRNGWAVYALLIVNATISWDTWITQYNISGKPKGVVDIHYLIHTVSDKNLYILEGNIERLGQIKAYPEIKPDEILSGIENKRRDFKVAQLGITGKSWNKADDMNRKAY